MKRKVYQEYEVAGLLYRLFLAIEHGDEEHRKWLKDKIEEFWAKEKESVKKIKIAPDGTTGKLQ